MTDTIQHDDGRVELQPHVLSEIEASPLYNEDLAPVPVDKRNWTTYNYAALWISMAHCIPTYMMASGLISAGMNWWQALLTILLGNTIVLAPILLNSHPGTKYGIPFPVFARAAYGTVGSNLPALMRALVACGWFGIQAWIGGQALQTFFAAFIPGWATLLGPAIGGHTPTEWFSFLVFWAMNIAIIYKGMDLLRIVENWAAPYVLVMTGILLGWILYQAGGIGFLLHEPGKFHTFGDFWPVFVPSLTAMIGFHNAVAGEEQQQTVASSACRESAGRAAPVAPAALECAVSGQSLEDNDVIIEDPSVSSHHAEFTWQSGPQVIAIRDLGSTNGTFDSASAQHAVSATTQAPTTSVVVEAPVTGASR